MATRTDPGGDRTRNQQRPPKRDSREALAFVVPLTATMLAGFATSGLIAIRETNGGPAAALAFGAVLPLTVGSFAFLLYITLRAFRTEKAGRQQVLSAENRVRHAPEKSQPAWDLARATLEQYFNRNLSQINWIFWLASAVMMGAFGLICFGIWQSFVNKDSTVPATLAGAAGVISQLISVTFLFLYRSTMERADDYVRQLERMNTIGMAMQILDTMKEEANENNLKDKTKAQLIDMFVRHAHMTSEKPLTIASIPGEVRAA